jgi:geranylgeranyl pyrophosphate synthase
MLSTLVTHPLSKGSVSVVETNSVLDRIISAPADVRESTWTTAIGGSLREYLQRPGKHFRAMLVGLSWELSHDPQSKAPPVPELLPWVVELLHAGSLIIDDIEDGSVQRRGQGALHRLVGVPVALNAGNWLYFRAIALLGELQLAPGLELTLHRRTLETVQWCHEGQALDLTVRVGDLHPRDIAELAYVISSRKTGSLLGLSGLLGALAAGAPEPLQQAMWNFGVRLGVGLQMQNDLSELMGSAGPLKQPEDLLHGRVTWPWAWAAERLSAHAFDALQARGARLTQGTGDAAALARDLLTAVGPDPRERVRKWLQEGYHELESVVRQRWNGDHSALTRLSAEVERLEKRYA